MFSNDSMITSERSIDYFKDLLEAIHKASAKEATLGQMLHDDSVKPEVSNLKAVEALASVTLPEGFGKLIALLDLQHSFLSLGRYVRGFTDAAYVLEKLQQLISERLAESVEQAKALTVIKELTGCAEMYATLLTAEKNNYDT